MIETKRLMMKLNQLCSANLGKVIYALFFMTLIESLCAGMLLAPVFLTILKGESSVQATVLSYILIFIAVYVWLTFQFGFSIMLLRMSRGERTTLGYIFIGFRKINPAGKVILGVALILAVTIAVSRIILTVAAGSLASVMPQAADDNTALFVAELAVFSVSFFILSCAALIKFSFVFQLHFDNPSESIPALFLKSARLMRGNTIRFILFALRAGGKPLLIAIATAVLTNLLPGEQNTMMSVLAFILNIVYFLNMYTALVRMYFTVPVLYNEILNPTPEHSDDAKELPEKTVPSENPEE